MNFSHNENKALAWIDIETPINNIIAHYQPVISLENNLTVGYEALARKIVDDKALAPIEWLPQILAEHKGSERLTKHMLALVLAKMSQVCDEQYISVNFEVEDIDNENLHSIIQKFHQQQYSHRLVIEISERGDLLNSSAKAIDKLKEYNLRIAFDDFGSGSARLLSLVDFQPNVIKLDKTVTDRIGESNVQSTLQLLSEWCESNGIKLLAEGIEQESQILHCINAGVHYGQGYYFGKPAEL
jgi:EAL domain-containing protein (putative c-di-GMP-specific phosphodiesterase class I)